MPLPFLFMLVVGGIASIAVLLHILGLSTRKTFSDADTVRAAWLREFSDDIPQRITLSRDHHAALVETANGQRGIVWPMGADTTARYLTGATLRQTASGLQIRLPDFTAPRISLTLDPTEAKFWAETGNTGR